MNGNFQERGGLWVVAQALLLLLVLGFSLLFQAADYCAGIFTAGAISLALGAVTGIAGALALGKNLTPFPQPLAQATLVRHGLYAYIRHPLYTSVVLFAAGWALAWQSWPALAVAALLVPFFDAKARREEAWLKTRFSEYEEYARATRRFIPWIY